MMTIARKSQLGGRIIIATLAVSIMIAAYSVNQIRLGGPLHRSDQLMNEFTADILPPPAYIVEPFLEATLLLEEPATHADRTERLARLESEYRTRSDHWRNSELMVELRSGLAGSPGMAAEKFWKELDTAFLPAARRGDEAAMKRSHDRLKQHFVDHKAAIVDLVARTGDAKQQVDASSEVSLWVSIALLILAAGVTMGLAMFGLRFLGRNALRPLAETANTMKHMAEGDFDAGRRSQHGDDEIGTMTRAIEVFRQAAIDQREAAKKHETVVHTLSNALDELAKGNLVARIDTPIAEEFEELRLTYNRTLDQLEDLIRKVAEGAGRVANGATEIRAASDDLSVRNEQQAASLEATSAAMMQATQSVKQTADRSNEVQQTIAGTHRGACEGGAVVRRANDAMASIERSAQEITQIIDVIDGIAFQTNLLALNAGVEAARAGDAGKGFAVVANEVRALAQRSADAARSIKELITASTDQVSDGVALVDEAGSVLEKIVGQVGEINELITEIASEANGQAANLIQVSAAVGEMDRMTQQNAAMVEQSTAAARSLASEANELTELVLRFRTQGRSASPAFRAESGRERPALPSLPETTIAFPSKQVRRDRSHAPPPLEIDGNLALASPAPADDDWSEF